MITRIRTSLYFGYYRSSCSRISANLNVNIDYDTLKSMYEKFCGEFLPGSLRTKTSHSIIKHRVLLHCTESASLTLMLQTHTHGHATSSVDQMLLFFVHVSHFTLTQLHHQQIVSIRVSSTHNHTHAHRLTVTPCHRQIKCCFFCSP